MGRLLLAFLTFVCCFNAVQASATERSFLIVFTNDRHGYLEPSTHPVTGLPVGGVAHEATLLSQLKRAARREKVPLLLVDAGDMFQGTPVVNATKGKCMVDLYNKLGYHLATFGNHEFDYGQEVLRQRMSESRFMWVSTNIDAPYLSSHYVPYVTYDLAGTRIAFLGVTTVTTPNITYPKNTEGVTFKEPKEALPPLIERLRRDRDVKVFILLSHLGNQSDEWLARKVEGIDLIIGGHSHTRLLEPAKVRNTWIVQASCNSRYVGLARVTLGADGQVRTVRSKLREVLHSLYPANREIEKELSKYTQDLNVKLDEVVGHAATPILKGFTGIDSPMGIICADSYREATGTEIGIMNVGGVRAGLEAGPVTMRQLMLISPFQNSVVKMNLKGKDLHNLLERSLSGIWHEIPEDQKQMWREAGRGKIAGKIPGKRKIGFLVGAGLKYSFDTSRMPGERLVKVEVLGERLDLERSYSVSMNSYLAFGGDGFSEFTRGSEIIDTKIVDSEALRLYFQSQGTVTAPTELSAENLTVQINKEDK